MDAGSGAGAPLVFVGSGAGKVHIFRLDQAQGTLLPQGAYDAGQNPSFLAFHPTGRFLYAVNEKIPGAVLSFAIDGTSGALTRLNEVSSGGDGPAHLSVDRAGRVLLSANYGSGTVGAAPITEDGSLGAPTDRQAPGEKAHQIRADPSNRWVLVPCLGSDRVAQFALDVDTGTLAPNAVPFVDSAAGSGPRHLDFHPSLPFAWVIHELANTLTAHAWDPDTGRLSPLQTVSTLPPGFGGDNTSAELRVHPNGRFLYGSNRGHDSIAVFAIDPATGHLTPLGHVPAGGAQPRHFTLTGDGALLLVANQASNNLHAFRVDPRSGALNPLGEVAQVPSPAFVGVRPLPSP